MVLCLDELSLVGVDDATTTKLKSGLTALAAEHGVSLFFDANGACLPGSGAHTELLAHARGRVTVLADRMRIVLMLLDERGTRKGNELVSHDKVDGFPSRATEALVANLLQIAGLTSPTKRKKSTPTNRDVSPTQEQVVAAAETLGKTTDVELDASRQPASSSMGWGPPLFWGAGGVALGLGVYFGVQARQDFDAVESNAYGSQLRDESGRHNQMGANICFVTGAVLAAVGTLWWLLTDTSPTALPARAAAGSTHGGAFAEVGFDW